MTCMSVCMYPLCCLARPSWPSALPRRLTRTTATTPNSSTESNNNNVNNDKIQSALTPVSPRGAGNKDAKSTSPSTSTTLSTIGGTIGERDNKDGGQKRGTRRKRSDESPPSSPASSASLSPSSSPLPVVAVTGSLDKPLQRRTAQLYNGITNTISDVEKVQQFLSIMRASATEADRVFLTQEIVTRITAPDCINKYVTYISADSS
jgi:hypothetical protein